MIKIVYFECVKFSLLSVVEMRMLRWVSENIRKDGIFYLKNVSAPTLHYIKDCIRLVPSDIG